MRTLLRALALLLLGLASAHAEDAPSFPSRPIRIIVPFTPGSATDTMARPIADRLSAALGQPVHQVTVGQLHHQHHLAVDDLDALDG